MAASRGEFSSRFGFIMAAAGSAVGLGNIWGFPTQAASNGGAAFLFVYVLLAFILAYPALMAEIILGRHANANAVQALAGVASAPSLKRVGATAGVVGFVVASLILSFYAIVAGWMISNCLAAIARLGGQTMVSDWLIGFSLSRNLLFMLLFMGLTIAIISAGVRNGIERWSSRLMPMLIIMLVTLVLYVLTLDGAMEGLRVYLMPDLNSALSPQLIINALGSAFFSLSLGVGTMLIYGSYIGDQENLPVAGGLVTLVDIGVAVLAGFLVLPTMYVALSNGVEIFALDGSLLSEDTLIFNVLPELFATMGLAGDVVSFVFFFLMSIAALTSSISMLEVPVAYSIENRGLKRGRAVFLIGGAIACVSAIILLNFGTLFGLVITVTTRYSQPILGIVFCIYVGWLWNRDQLLGELKKGSPTVEQTLFWKLWPWHLRLVCPAIILLIFVQSIR
ncbi:MAG: sodium-dependent transporter [Pseudomonadota bacterium]